MWFGGTHTHTPPVGCMYCVTVGRLGDSDGAILVGVGHREGVALGVAG